MRELLAGTRVIPVMTLERAEDAVPLARALVNGGLKVLEVTLRTSVASECIRRILAEVEGVIVGAGTVCTPAQIELSHDLGCRFMVSPGSTDSLLNAAAQAPLPLLPGIASVGEMMRGMELGYQDFKLFPAEMVGGMALLRAIAGPFPNIRFCPTGGIGQDNFRDYLKLPNVLCVGGSWILPADAIAAKRWDIVEKLARETASLR